ncbi:hypothetical protein GW17_00024940 [Ensete ventricosum]|nr:hypothetical protein GW17_00024940 [Ensete ventricosum]
MAVSSYCCLASRHTHVISFVLMTSSRASDRISSRCVSTNPILCMQWSHDPFSFLGDFVTIASHFILSYAPIHCAYSLVV